MKGYQKVAVNHVLSAAKHKTLHDLRTSDLSLSHHGLRKDYHGFSKHAIKLAVLFQIVDTGALNRGGNLNGCLQTAIVAAARVPDTLDVMEAAKKLVVSPI